MWKGTITGVTRDGFESEVFVDYVNGEQIVKETVDGSIDIKAHVAARISELNDIDDKIEEISTDLLNSKISVDGTGKVTVEK